jgi:4-amino-4-deoxy-L-arabinose transferase-like glycosyltransferase
MDFLKKHSYYIVAGILLLFFIVSLFVSKDESMVFDEKAHIPAAYSYVRFGDMRLNPEHPPLIKDLAGLPLLALNLSFPIQSQEWQSGINEQWALGDMFVNCTQPDIICNDADAILFWSRLPIILIAVILGIGIFIWTKELSGTLAGLFALTLYAADPNIIAHNHYVTTDIGIAAFIFFAFYFFVRFLKKPNLENVVVAGIFLGMAELAKFSAVLLFPVFGLFVILYALTKQKPDGNMQNTFSFKLQTLLQYSFKFSGSILVCFALIWSLYAFNTFNMPAEKTVINVNQVFNGDEPIQILARNFIGTLSDSQFLRPFAHYFLGVFMVFARVAGGNTHYFLGTVSAQASVWYFPIVFILKETLPFLFLLFAVLFYAISQIIKVINKTQSIPSYFSAFAHSFQNKPGQYLIVFFVLFYSYISITGNLTIGFRHLFPILPFLYILIAKTVFDFLKRRENEYLTHTMFSWMLGGLTFVIVAIPALTYPHYLSYFNPVIGGNVNGYQYVTDSNYDWGQDLKNLKVFVETHNNCKAGTALSEESRCALTKEYPPINQIRVDYFGGGSPTYYLKEKFIPWNDKREPEVGWYAISSFFYQESLYKKEAPNEHNYEWFRNIKPVTRAGDSIFIYYVPEIKYK